MYKIVVKGETGGCSHPELLPELDGVDCQDVFSEYFGASFNIGDKHYENEQALIDKGVEGGYLYFKYEGGKLYSIVTYSSKEELNDAELELLKNYTSGQLSDGIGEGFEQQPCYYTDEDEDVFLSPWHYGQELTVTQSLK